MGDISESAYVLSDIKTFFMQNKMLGVINYLKNSKIQSFGLYSP